MHSQDSRNNCLSEAMFIASHSYSGSIYETGVSRMMECNDASIFAPENEMTASSAIAA